MDNKYLLNIALLVVSNSAFALDDPAQESYDFAYKSTHSITSYQMALTTFPQFDVSSSNDEVVYDRRLRHTNKVSVTQAVETEKQKLATFTPSKTTKWQEKYLPQPALSKLKSVYTFPVVGKRIPVYYAGDAQVLNRVVLQDSTGQLYFTAKFGSEANDNIHFSSNKLTYRLTNLNGEMQGNGYLKYRESNPFQAAKAGYIVEVALNSNVKNKFVIAPSLRINGTYTEDLSTKKRSNSANGYAGDDGSGYSSSFISSFAGAFGGGNGGDGSNGSNGQPGRGGKVGNDGKDVGRVEVNMKPVESPFYKQQLKSYAHKSEQGSTHLLFELDQKITLTALGGAGGNGGKGGAGGDGGDGEAGSAGLKGSNATKYSSGGSGGSGGDGGNGGNGARGGSGGDGGDGGNGGKVVVKLSGSSYFQSASRRYFSASVRGGEAGKAGKGGKGGEAGNAGDAGPGGPGGSAYSGSECRTDVNGLQQCTPIYQSGGSSGYSGNRGRSGSSASAGGSGSGGSRGGTGSVQFVGA